MVASQEENPLLAVQVATVELVALEAAQVAAVELVVLAVELEAATVSAALVVMQAAVAVLEAPEVAALVEATSIVMKMMIRMMIPTNEERQILLPSHQELCWQEKNQGRSHKHMEESTLDQA